MSEVSLLRATVDEMVARTSNEGLPEAAAFGAALQERMAAAGLDALGVAETLGGGGGTLEDAAVVAGALGRWPIPSPFTEGSVAAWLAARAGLPVPSGLRTIAIAGPLVGGGNEGGPMAGAAIRGVRWARASNSLVVLAVSERSHVVVVPSASVQMTLGSDVAGDPSDGVELAGVIDSAAIAPVGPSVVRAARLRLALLRGCEVSSALERLVELARDFALTRRQFGKPISDFQVIRHALAEAAAEAFVTNSAMQRAVQVAAEDETSPVIIAAHVRAGLGAARVTRIVHQIHGAVGITDGHPVAELVRRVAARRLADGPDRRWEIDLASCVRDRGGPWSLLTR